MGSTAAAQPDLVREIVRRGHSVENHSQHHPGVFAAYGLNRLRREIESRTGNAHRDRRPRAALFRAPAGLRSPLLDPVLSRLGLTYVSWTRRGLDTIDANPATVLRRLTRGLSAGDVLTLHDRPAVRRAATYRWWSPFCLRCSTGFGPRTEPRLAPDSLQCMIPAHRTGPRRPSGGGNGHSRIDAAEPFGGSACADADSGRLLRPMRRGRTRFVRALFDRSAAEYETVERIAGLGAGEWYRG